MKTEEKGRKGAQSGRKTAKITAIALLIAASVTVGSMLDSPAALPADAETAPVVAYVDAGGDAAQGVSTDGQIKRADAKERTGVKAQAPSYVK